MSARTYTLRGNPIRIVSQGGGVVTSRVSVGTSSEVRTASRNALIWPPIIKEFVPASWFHPRGVFKVLARIRDRLPDVSGKLFLTLTIDPKQFTNEEVAFEQSRQWLRKVFYRLRHGVEHEGRTYLIDAPYCIKVEFHESGWVHYHVIFLTRHFLPKELLAELWGLGWVKVQRITNRDFDYLLKYVTKAADLPDWIKQRKRLRVFQSSRGFLKPLDTPKPKPAPDEKQAEGEQQEKKVRASFTIGERFGRWDRMGVIRSHNTRTIRFRVPFRDLFDHLVLSAALDGRYEGGGVIVMEGKGVIGEWIRMQNQLLEARN